MAATVRFFSTGSCEKSENPNIVCQIVTSWMFDRFVKPPIILEFNFS